MYHLCKRASCIIPLYLFVLGLNGYNIDPTSLAMDYRTVGFRECAAEVARYLVTVEGLDIQDPLRLRLMSHLQCYSSQREAASKVRTIIHKKQRNLELHIMKTHCRFCVYTLHTIVSEMILSQKIIFIDIVSQDVVKTASLWTELITNITPL